VARGSELSAEAAGGKVPPGERLVGRREWAWVVLWACLVMGLTCGPYLYAWRIAGSQTFAGSLWGVDEGNVYLAWVRQASEGHGFLHNQYCLAPENPRFFNLYLQSGGRLSACTGWSPLMVWQGLRVMAGLFLLLSLYRLAAELSPDRIARWASLLLASLGSGLGWLVVLQGGSLGVKPIDVGTDWQVQPEAVTFLSLLLSGLFVTSMGLMCQGFIWAVRALRDDSRRAAVVSGLCLLVLGNIHTYNVFPVHLALILWSGSEISRQRLTLQKAWRQYALIAGVSLPAVGYALYAALADPAFMAKGLTPTPAFGLADYVVGYGLIGLLAVGGAWHWGGRALQRKNRAPAGTCQQHSDHDNDYAHTHAQVHAETVIDTSNHTHADSDLSACASAKVRANSRVSAAVAVSGDGACSEPGSEGSHESEYGYGPEPERQSGYQGEPQSRCKSDSQGDSGFVPTGSHGSEQPLAVSNPQAQQLSACPQVVTLIIAWAVAGSVVLLIPVSFQRKMIEGLHLPLCLLAGLTVASLARWLTRGLRAQGRHKQAGERVVLTVVAVAVFALPSNALFVADCLGRLKSNNLELAGVLQPPLYLSEGETKALEWLRDNSTAPRPARNAATRTAAHKR
jgi:hypothetical protein